MTVSPVLLAWKRHSAAAFSFASMAGRRMKIGLAEVAALEHLETGGPLTPGEIGRRLSMPSGSVTALVDRLEAKRFVQRRPNPKDRRGYLISLSESAMDRAALDLIPMGQELSRIVDTFNAQDQAAIIAFLDRAATALSGRGARSVADRRPT